MKVKPCVESSPAKVRIAMLFAAREMRYEATPPKRPWQPKLFAIEPSCELRFITSLEPPSISGSAAWVSRTVPRTFV